MLPQVISLLSSLPLSSLSTKNEVDRALQEKGLLDGGMRAFALTNVVQGEASVRWEINLAGIER
jgi:hypothetical protein